MNKNRRTETRRGAGRWALGALLAGALLVTAGCVPYHRQQGMLAYERGDYAEAAEHYRIVVANEPADWKANYRLGLLALEDGKASEARTYLEQAYAVRADGPPSQPETPQILDALAEAIYLEGDVMQLYGLCSEAAKQYGTAHDHVRTGKYLMLAGDHDAAAVAFARAKRLAEPGDAEPYVAMADLYERVGDRDNAALELRRAYGADARAPGVADRLRGYGIVPGPTAALPGR